MGRKAKSHYDAMKHLRELLEIASALYEEKASLRKIGSELDMGANEVIKLLVTGEVYESETADRVRECHSTGMKVPEIMEELSLSRSSVFYYLPYTKGTYKGDDASANALRIRNYRKRVKLLQDFHRSPTMEALWEMTQAFENYNFYTKNSQKFNYETSTGKGLTFSDNIFVSKEELWSAYRAVLGKNVSEVQDFVEFTGLDHHMYYIFQRFQIVS